MKQILHNWLLDIGIFVDMDNLAQIMKDGKLLLKLLKYYKIINPNSTIFLKPENDNYAFVYNLRQLRVWMELLGIKFDENIIKDIAEGSFSSCIALLTDLYKHVEISNTLPVISKESERFRMSKLNEGSRFSVQKAKEELMGDSIMDSGRYNYNASLVKKSDIISRFREKHPTKQQTRLPPAKEVKNIAGASPRCNKSSRLSKGDVVRECIEEFNKLQSSTCSPFLLSDTAECSFLGHHIHSTDTTLQYVSNLSNAHLDAIADGKVREEYELMSERDAWNRVFKLEEDFHNDLVSSSILTQSRFEKKMFTKLFQLLHQDRVQRYNFKCMERRKCLLKHEMKPENGGQQIENMQFYHSEKKRTAELHWKLYADNLKMRLEKIYSICLSTVESIIDLAIKRSEYQNCYNVKMSENLWREWKSLYFNGQPIFKTIQVDVCDLLKDNRHDSMLFEEEWERQGVLNDHNLDDYLSLDGDWFLHKIKPESEPILREHQLILSHIIHELLDVKFPCSSKPEPANIPKYPVRAVINNIDDESIVEKLREIFSKHGILLVDVNSAINYCVQTYIDSELDIMTSLSKPDNESDEVSSDNTKNISQDFDLAAEIKFKTCSAQTSLSHSDLKVDFKEDLEAVIVGQKLVENMKICSEIQVSLIVDAIIAFIQRQKPVSGWVIINFPSTLHQASLLEFALSPSKFPYPIKDDNASDFSASATMLSKDSSSSRYEELSKMYAKIVMNLTKRSGGDKFRTYLTHYVLMKKNINKSEPETPMKFNTTKQSIFTSSIASSGDTNYDILLEQPTGYGIPSIETFYRNERIRNDFSYDNLDEKTLEQLVLLILSSRRSSQEDNYSARSWMKTQSKLGRTSLSSSSKMNLYASMTAWKSCSGSFLFGSNNSFDDIKYVDLQVQSNVSISLADTVEHTVSTYLNNLKDALFVMRVHRRTVVPYFHIFSQDMTSCFYKSDDRQSMVSTFLHDYNNIAPVLLLDEDMVMEVHRRASELERNLTELSEEKRRNVYRVRDSFIYNEWAINHLMAVAEAFILILKAEVFRFCKTLQLLQDYYSSGLNMSLKVSDAVPSINVDNIDILSNSKPKETDSLDSESTLSIDGGSSLILSIMEERLRNIKQNILKIKDSCMSLRSKLESQKISEEEKKMENALKDVASNKKGKTGKAKNKVTKVEDAQKQEEIRRKFEEDINHIKSVFIEWSDAANIEVQRALFRVDLIIKKAELDISVFKKSMKDIVSKLQSESDRIYREEIECVRKIRKLFGTAVEENTHLHVDIFYNHTDLFVLKKVVEEEPEPVKIPPALCPVFDYSSPSPSIEQLESVFKRLMLVAPSGTIPKQVLTIFMHEVSQSDYRGTWLWGSLTTDKLKNLFDKLFGELDIVDWKDMIVSCLQLPFPTMEDVIDAKQQFVSLDQNCSEVVSYDDFMKTTLWFERELPESPSQALYILLAKKFLFQLFSACGGLFISYPALMMAFCKDIEPSVGIGKVLAYLTGRCVIVYEEDKYLENVCSDHKDTARKIVLTILNELIDDIVYAVCLNDAGELHILENNNDNNNPLKGNESPDSSDVLFESLYCPFFRRLKVLNWTCLVPLEVVEIFLKFLCSQLSHYPEWMTFELEDVLQPFIKTLNSVSYVYVPGLIPKLLSKEQFPVNYFIAFRVAELMKK